MGLKLGLLATLATLGTAVMTSGAAAQVSTPSNCHWVALPDSPTTIEMWCRADDGRARPTGRTLEQGAAPTTDDCPAGKLYDGERCVSEAAALAAAPQEPYIGPERSSSPGPKTDARPRVLLFQDRDGRRIQGMACINQRDVIICRPIPRY